MRYFIGIDFGGTFIKGAVISESGVLICKEKVPTRSKGGDYSVIISDMAKLVGSLEKSSGKAITAIGIGSPGAIDSANGVVIYNNNIGWRNVPVCAELSGLTNLPCFVANDANVAALGEKYYGSGKSYDDIIFLTLGTGVGGGIVIGGKLFEGYKSVGAEVGHAVIKMGGEACACGRRGCFEAYASATALIRRTKRAMQADPDSILWQLCDGDLNAVDGKTAFDGMRAGDKTSVRVVRTYIRYLSEGVLNLCNEFRPQAVILGGGICAEGETLLVPLRKRVNKYIYGGVSYAPVDILTASLGNDAGVYGAARIAIEKSIV